MEVNMKMIPLVQMFFLTLFTLSVSGRHATGKEKVWMQFRTNFNYLHDEEMLQKNIENIKSHIELFKKYGVKCDYLFTGLVFNQLRQASPELIKMIIDNNVPIVHHGANRLPRPMPIDRVKGENWKEDVQAIIDYESYAIDPVSGELDRNRVGGITYMQQELNNSITLTGRFMYAPILYAEKLMGCKAGIGLLQNTGAPINDAWFIGMVSMPEGKIIEPPVMKEFMNGERDLITELNDWVEDADPNKNSFLALPVHDFDFLPRERGEANIPLVIREQEIEKFREAYERMIRWAVEHPDVRVVTHREIIDRVIDDRSKTVSRENLLKAAKQILSSKDAPPIYIDLDDDYLSLSDCFQAFVFSLRGYNNYKVLPFFACASDILGPTEYRGIQKPQGKMPTFSAEERRIPASERNKPIVTTPPPAQVNLSVSGESVIITASGLDLTSKVPAAVELSGREIHAGVFLYCMASVYQDLYNGKNPQQIRLNGLMHILPKQVQENRQADALTKLQFWTFKPMRFYTD